MHIINFKSSVTSKSFYDNILPQLNQYSIKNSNERVKFDFSEITSINPIVLPYIFSVADAIKRVTKKKTIFSLPPYESLEDISRYLVAIGFYTVSKEMDLFDYEFEPMYSSTKDRKYSLIDFQRYCSAFDYKNDDIVGSGRFLGKLWSFFLYQDEATTLDETEQTEYNEIFANFKKVGLDVFIAKFKREFNENARDHAYSNAYSFGNYIKSFRKIYLCFSDAGRGLDYGIMRERKASALSNNVSKDKQSVLIFEKSKRFFDDFHLDTNCKQILEALFLRRKLDNVGAERGLYGLLKKLAEYQKQHDKKAIFRIHSDRCRIRISGKQINEVVSETVEKLPNDKFVDFIFDKFVANCYEENKEIQSTGKFNGFHIECELEY